MGWWVTPVPAAARVVSPSVAVRSVPGGSPGVAVLGKAAFGRDDAPRGGLESAEGCSTHPVYGHLVLPLHISTAIPGELCCVQERTLDD